MEELNRRRHKNPPHSKKKKITGQERKKNDVDDDGSGNILATPADVIQKVEHTEYETEKCWLFFYVSCRFLKRLAASTCSAHVWYDDE